MWRKRVLALVLKQLFTLTRLLVVQLEGSPLVVAQNQKFSGESGLSLLSQQSLPSAGGERQQTASQKTAECAVRDREAAS